MVNINDCKDYLINNSFSNVEFTHQEENNFYFTAFCEDHEENCSVMFEPMKDNSTIFVNVKYSNDDNYLVFERLIKEN